MLYLVNKGNPIIFKLIDREDNNINYQVNKTNIKLECQLLQIDKTISKELGQILHNSSMVWRMRTKTYKEILLPNIWMKILIMTWHKYMISFRQLYRNPQITKHKYLNQLTGPIIFNQMILLTSSGLNINKFLI